MSGQIGPHIFDYLVGNVPSIQQEIEVITKAGEDGHRRRRIGRRSETFRLETLGTYSTVTAARLAFAVFSAMPDGPSQGLIKDGHNYTVNNENVKVAILHVQQLELQKKACIAGTDNLWLLRVEWTLRLVPNA